MELGLRGRTAVIAGGTLGIGRAIALGLRAEGVNLVVLGRDADRLAATANALAAVAGGGEVMTVGVDVRDAAGVDTAASRITDRFGAVNIVVNNAGNRMRPGRQIRWTDDDLWMDIDTKLFGMLRIVRAIEPFMPADGTGRIINISGVAGSIVWETALTHGINNSAMNQATRYLATDLAPRRITVNAVIPGLIATEWRHDWAQASAERSGISKDQFVANTCRDKGILLGRWAESSEVADTVAFLASDRAAYITGTTIAIDGGLSANAR